MAILVAILVISVIILVHELGHFLAAKHVGIEVEEFSIGFGPRLTGFHAIDTKFSVRAIPLGGFVRMLGEEDEEQQSAQGSYPSKTPLQRMYVIAAGPVMNFLLAILLFMLIFGVVGLPVLSEARIGSVLPDLPAEQAGLQAGDRVLELDGQPVETWGELQEYIMDNPHKSINFLIQRNGQQLEVPVTPRMTAEGAQIGISAPIQRLGIIDSIREGIRQTYEVTKVVLVSIYQIFTRQLSAKDLTGPIGIVYYVGAAARAGLVNVLSLAALISVNLGLFNLLPIPALDGSKLVFLTVELVRRRPLDPQKENLVHLVGFALLVSLMIVVMYRDILRFIVG